MMVVIASFWFSAPDEAAAQLVEIAAFGQDNITRAKPIALYFRSADADFFHLREIKMPVLYVRDTEVGHFDRYAGRAWSECRGDKKFGEFFW